MDLNVIGGILFVVFAGLAMWGLYGLGSLLLDQFNNIEKMQYRIAKQNSEIIELLAEEVRDGEHNKSP